MAIGRVETQTVVVIISLNSHFFTQFNSVLVAHMSQISTPLEDKHDFLDGSLFLSLRFFPLKHFELQFSRKSLEVSSRLKYKLNLHIVLYKGILLIKFSYYLVSYIQNFGEIFFILKL